MSDSRRAADSAPRGFVLPEDKLTLEQRGLRIMCKITLAWASVSFVIDEASLLVDKTPLFAMFSDFGVFAAFLQASIVPALIFAATAAYALLGAVGARTPAKITPFFAIAFVCAMLGGWDLASRISLGTAPVAYTVEVLFVIATACLAWQVKKTTYPEDWYERKEAAKARRRQAKKNARTERKALRENGRVS